MNFKEYQELAARTINKKLTVAEQINNAVYGLVGESGEVVDHLKKHLFHGHEVDVDQLEKEIGDVLWYVAALATSNGLDLERIAVINIDKLRHRYPDGFSVEASINRDKISDFDAFRMRLRKDHHKAVVDDFVQWLNETRDASPEAHSETALSWLWREAYPGIDNWEPK